jgi:DNA-binding PadR family transcriptional regulator
MAKRRKVGNLLALALLALLMPGVPMHPYEMASVLRRTGKENDMKIKWGSLYTVVQNLEKNGLIEATSSNREGRRPERTIYAITEAGRVELRDWLRELVAIPEPEYPRFQAALSVLGVLPPDEVTDLLTQRVQALEQNIVDLRTSLRESGAVPRVFLVEVEYALAICEAETAWVRSLLRELADGSLSGVAEWRTYHETGEIGPEWAQLIAEGGTPTD